MSRWVRLIVVRIPSRLLIIRIYKTLVFFPPIIIVSTIA
jgi:hypothetical protein